MSDPAKPVERAPTFRERAAAAWRQTKPRRDRIKARVRSWRATALAIPLAIVAANPLMVLLVLSAHALAVSVLWVGIVACWRYILR